MGIHGGANGFYQRRDSTNRPQKSQEDETPEMVTTSSESPLESSIALQGTSIESKTTTDEQPGAAGSISMPAARTIINMKKNAKLRKKKRSSKIFDVEDDSYAFGSKKKSRKETTSDVASASVLSVTPKGCARKIVHSSNGKTQDGGDQKEETAKLPTVTPFVESGVPTNLPSQAESEVVQKKRASPATEDWRSPQPFSQNSQSLEEELAEDQRQVREEDVNAWKKQNSEKDKTARSLEEAFSVDKDKMEQEHARALKDAVHQERARMEELFSQERRELVSRQGSLQKEVDKLHVKQEMNAKALVDLSCSQREGHDENERLTREIRRLKMHLEASRSEVAALKQWKEDALKKDPTMTHFASIGASRTEEEPKRLDERVHKRPSNRLIAKTKPMADPQQRDTKRQSPDARKSPALSVNSKRRSLSPQKSKRHGSDSDFSFPTPGDNSGGSAIQPLQYKTQPGRRSSSRESPHNRTLHALVPSYDFLHGYEVMKPGKTKKSAEFKFEVED